ncbi:hypothetical protein NQ318_001156 [Aromia moschata]|uniref:Uncharacterized protein n=1 Tax=Aromia moschata TaxID=1265417 RepID=A0AAV8ZGA6_9CUCU|nr:hypothetical protein NQ318_001156 [Aromia moschata]
MAFKLVVFAAFVTLARAGHLAAPSLAYGHGAVSAYSTVAHAPAVAAYAHVAPVAPVVAEPSAPAHYDFGYSVSDPHTGDAKSQHESRRGDVVQGSYSLLDSDGTKRLGERKDFSEAMRPGAKIIKT